MARIRTIKPEFWTSEQVVTCSPLARLLFVGLWTFSDDHGIHPAAVRRLKMEVFPADTFDDATITGLVAELVDAGLVQQYDANGERFWIVTGWHRHQRIDKPTFRHPLPPDAAANPSPIRQTLRDDSSSARRDVGDPSPLEWTGTERKGLEIPGPVAGDFSNPKNRKTQRSSIFANLETNDLQDPLVVADWFRAASGRDDPVVTHSTMNLLNVLGAAVRVLRPGKAKKNPVAMFADIVRNGRWGDVSQADEDVARKQMTPEVKAIAGVIPTLNSEAAR